VKISTLVTLNQEELQGIAVSYALEQLNISDATLTSVEFVDDENGNLQAKVSIDTDDAAGEPKTDKPKAAAAKGGRGKARAKDAAPVEVKTETPPWEDKDATVEQLNQAEVEQGVEQTSNETGAETPSEEPVAETAAVVVPKIFQDLKNSAAQSNKPELPANPKSLFAGLAKPINGAH
jgi:hypothetical protein